MRWAVTSSMGRRKTLATNVRELENVDGDTAQFLSVPDRREARHHERGEQVKMMTISQDLVEVETWVEDDGTWDDAVTPVLGIVLEDDQFNYIVMGDCGYPDVYHSIDDSDNACTKICSLDDYRRRKDVIIGRLR